MQNVDRRSYRGCLWAAGIGAALVLFACAGLAALLWLGVVQSGTAGGEAWQEEHVAGEGARKVAVLPVTGVIGLEGSLLSAAGASPEELRDQLDQAAEDDDVVAIVLQVDSPGGGVVASDEMHQALLDFKEEAQKPVVVSMGATAASGGYYISTAADRIVANRMTLTGSLGVILSYLNYEEAAEKIGVEEVVIKSGEYKDIGSPARDLTAEEREILQNLIDETYAEFVEVIVQGRELPEERVRELADGRIYSGQQAKDLGLVDELGDLERAAEIAAQLAEEDDYQVVRYVNELSLFDLLSARLHETEPDAVKLLESAGLSITPELQYLYRP